MNFLNKIFGVKNTEGNYKPKITVQKIQHIFEYGKMNNFNGTNDMSKWDLKLGNIISFAEGYYYKGSTDFPAQYIPQNIQWSNNPIFAFVSIVNDKVLYHWSEMVHLP